LVRKVQFMLLVFIIPFVFSVCLTHGEAANPIKNPGFEETSGVLPKEWVFKEGTVPQGVKYEISKNQPHSGSNCLVITNTEAADTLIIQKVKVKPDQAYHFSCWIRTENIAHQPGSANITLYYGDNGFGCKGIITSKEFSNTGNQWQLLDFNFKTLKIADPLSIAIRLGGQGTKNQGTAYFDDLSMELIKNPGVSTVFASFFVPGKEQTSSNQNSGAPVSGNSNPIVIYIILGILGLGLLAYFEIKLTKKEKKDNPENPQE
jgi:dolichyl-phosphate-mannose-protein mannosyltransferase